MIPERYNGSFNDLITGKTGFTFDEAEKLIQWLFKKGFYRGGLWLFLTGTQDGFIKSR